MKGSSTIRCPRLRSIVVWALLAFAGGCTPKPAQVPSAMPLPELRAAAEASPHDAKLQKALAEAEMFHPKGEAARVDKQLERARALLPKDLRLRLLAAIQADVHGHPDLALEGLVESLALAATSDDPFAAHMAEFSVQALSGLEGGVSNYAARTEAALQAALPKWSGPTRWAATDLAIHLAYLRGDVARVDELAKAAGCLTSFRTAGPFGPLDLLEFDRDHGVDLARPLAASYDLGPGRGVRATRTLGGHGCSVNLGGDPIAAGGVRYATGEVVMARAGSYLLRVDSPNTVAVFIDGRTVSVLDRRKLSLPRVAFVPVELGAGTHRVTLKLASRHPDPVVRVAILPQGERDAAATALPPLHHSGFALYLRATLQMLRGDVVGARVSLAPVRAGLPVSPHLLSLKANVLFNDPLGPDDVLQDHARQLLVAALHRDGGQWNPIVQLASLAANNGRVDEAIDALRAAYERFSDVPAIGLTLVQMLNEREFYAEADRIVLALRKRVPDACAPMFAELSVLRRRRREAELSELTEAIMVCNARSNARYALLTRRRDWPGVATELARLSSMDPPQSQFAWSLAALELARQRGNGELTARVLADLRQRFPRYAGAVLEAVDLRLSEGQTEQAARLIDEAIAAEPSAMSGLWRLRPLVGQSTALARFRRDGLAAIAAFEQSGRSYEQPQVLVFDYMATRIFEDGSAIELVHTVQKAQSDEAVDELAEVEVPEGARFLTLRTIKADGRVLEPDPIAGKDTLSLPSVAVGDYVEMEFVREHEAPRAFPNGYLGDRFYFKSFEVPFDHSEMVYVTPVEMELEADPRGAAPTAETEIVDGLRVTRWMVDQSDPLTMEPGSVPAREYIPSVRVSHAATWERFFDSLREVLIDRDVRDPELVSLTETIVGEAGPEDHALRAQRLYGWVLENIENSNDSFSQAAIMLRARSGNRARVLHYLLGLSGVPSELALVRSAAADTTPSSVPDTDTFEHLLVRVGGDENPTWLYLNERHAPYGFVPALLQGEVARLLREGAPLVRLPDVIGPPNHRALDVTVAMDARGGAHLTVVEEVSGAGAVAWRTELENIPPAELERRFEQDYVSRLIPGSQLTALEVVGRERERPALTLRYELDVAVLGRRIGDNWALPSMLTTELAANYARVANRTTGLLIGGPLSVDVTFRYQLPAGTGRPSPPPTVSLTGPLGKAQFAQTVETDGGQLIVRRRMSMPIMRVAPEQYPAFAEFCRKVDTLEAAELVYRMPGG